ncbi:MAG TPA: hypothetical protein VND93_15975, partial [Myxococcales bacterium]|nr:hypothetical protein [Myxococcales bacterium]
NVIAGALALLAFGLVFVDPCLVTGTWGDAVWIAAVGVSYVVGVVFDRAFDRFLKNGEDWVEILTAAKRSGPDPEPKPHSKQKQIEARLRVAFETAGEWMSYLRTRVRVARALALTAPWIGASALHWWRWRQGTNEAVDFKLVPLLVFVVGWSISALPPDADRMGDRARKRYLGPNVRSFWPMLSRLAWWTLWWVIWLRGLVFLYVAALDFALIGRRQGEPALAVMAVALLVGAGATFVWQSVLATYLKFIVRAGAQLDEEVNTPRTTRSGSPPPGR